MLTPELLIVGGGIIGCSAAALAAERGASVILLEATEVGAGASGRNSGAVQHPFDLVLGPLHQRSLDIYRDLSGTDGFAFPADPAGLLLLTDDLEAAAARVAELRGFHPALAPELLDEAALRALEPMLAEGFAAIRLATGYPIPPDAATRAMAARAMRAGAELRVGKRVAEVSDGAVRLADGTHLSAANVLVATGPWTPGLLSSGGSWPLIRATYGVTVQVGLDSAPTSILEEGAVHTVNRQVGDEAGEADEADEGLITFSMVSSAGTSTVGSTFLPTSPDPAAMGSRLVAHGARFVPALAKAAILQSRVCARPQAIDGHPFIGAMPGRERIFVAAGHGPWGISIGPATAELVIGAILDGFAIAPALDAGRSI